MVETTCLNGYLSWEGCETGQAEFFVPFIHMEMILGSFVHQCLSEAISFPDNVTNQPLFYAYVQHKENNFRAVYVRNFW